MTAGDGDDGVGPPQGWAVQGSAAPLVRRAGRCGAWAVALGVEAAVAAWNEKMK
jgi:hypothetical protein